MSAADEAKAALSTLILSDEERELIYQSLGAAWQAQFAELGRSIQDPNFTKEEVAAMQARLGRLHQLQKRILR